MKGPEEQEDEWARSPLQPLNPPDLGDFGHFFEEEEEVEIELSPEPKTEEGSGSGGTPPKDLIAEYMTMNDLAEEGLYAEEAQQAFHSQLPLTVYGNVGSFPFGNGDQQRYGSGSGWGREHQHYAEGAGFNGGGYNGGSWADDEETIIMGHTQLLNPFTPFGRPGTGLYEPRRTIIPIKKPGGEIRASQNQDAEPDDNHPFSCDLCSEKFKKKLFLNNHMENRHGIKFVFTEKGKKVKLVRMPTELKEGEKLDPCVRLLIDSNGNNAANMLGVQPVETVGEQNMAASRQPTAHEIDPYDILAGKTQLEKDFGSAILVDTIRTFGMKKALERGETPFVAYRPHRAKKLYLLAITNFSKQVQLLMPATEDDLESADGVIKEAGSYFMKPKEGPPEGTAEDTEVDSGAGPSRNLVQVPCHRYRHVCIVQYVEQVPDPETGKLVLNCCPRTIEGPVSLMKPDDFARTMLRSKPKRLRCMSIPQRSTAPAPAPDQAAVPKRKYTRRSFGRRSNACGLLSLPTPLPTVTEQETKEEMPEEVLPEPLGRSIERASRKRKHVEAEESEPDADDEDSDATYLPYKPSGATGSGKRGRGRPRKNSI